MEFLTDPDSLTESKLKEIERKMREHLDKGNKANAFVCVINNTYF